jgi:hypothetical protein
MRDARAANLLSSVRGLSHRKIGVIARLDRAIQYAAAFPYTIAVSGILDSPLSRGMTAEVE